MPPRKLNAGAQTKDKQKTQDTSSSEGPVPPRDGPFKPCHSLLPESLDSGSQLSGKSPRPSRQQTTPNTPSASPRPSPVPLLPLRVEEASGSSLYEELNRSIERSFRHKKSSNLEHCAPDLSVCSTAISALNRQKSLKIPDPVDQRKLSETHGAVRPPQRVWIKLDKLMEYFGVQLDSETKDQYALRVIYKVLNVVMLGIVCLTIVALVAIFRRCDGNSREGVSGATSHRWYSDIPDPVKREERGVYT